MEIEISRENLLWQRRAEGLIGAIVLLALPVNIVFQGFGGIETGSGPIYDCEVVPVSLLLHKSL